MRILLTAYHSSFLAGFERNNIQLLQKMGYEVHCACNCAISEETRSHQKVLEDMGVIVHQIDYSRSPFDVVMLRRVYRQLDRLVRENSFAAVHCHTPIASLIMRLVAKKQRLQPVIYTAHGFHFYKGCPIKNRILYQTMESIMARYTDALITINEEDFQAAKKMHVRGKAYKIPGVGLLPHKYQLKHPDEYDRQQFRSALGINADDFMILSVGELNDNKNHQLVIAAIAAMDNPHIHYCIAGSGGNDVKYKNMAKNLGISKQIHILGMREDIAELNTAADVFAFPTIREGLGMAALEALACGTPVCAVENRGSKEYVINGKNGYLHANTVQDCVMALLKIKNASESERLSMQKDCIQIAEKFSALHSRCVMETIYQNVIASSSHV